MSQLNQRIADLLLGSGPDMHSGWYVRYDDGSIVHYEHDSILGDDVSISIVLKVDYDLIKAWLIAVLWDSENTQYRHYHLVSSMEMPIPFDYVRMLLPKSIWGYKVS